MTPNQKPPLGFGFSTPENPRIRIFSKCIRKLAPQFKKGFFQKYALTIRSRGLIDSSSNKCHTLSRQEQYTDNIASM